MHPSGEPLTTAARLGIGRADCTTNGRLIMKTCFSPTQVHRVRTIKATNFMIFPDAKSSFVTMNFDCGDDVEIGVFLGYDRLSYARALFDAINEVAARFPVSS